MVRCSLAKSGSVFLTLFIFLLFAAGQALAQQNVFSPGDPIILVNGVNDGDANAGAPPAAEGVEHSIDRLTSKYLHFLDLGSGFVATPAVGVTIVNSIRFYTANDALERDPASYLLEGANGPGGPWTVIAQGPLALPDGRNPGGQPIDPNTQFNQTVAFPNTAPYASYRVTFPTLKNAATANSMQIGEVELLGGVPQIQKLTLIGLTNQLWAYNDATVTPGLHGTGWELPGYNTNSVAGWKVGFPLFGNDSAGIYDAAGQPFSGGLNGFFTPLDRLINGAAARVTFYLRTSFTWNGPTTGVSLVSSNWVDDGIVVYLNGVEATRLRLAAGATTWDTLGSNPGTEGAVEVLQWNASGLVQGANTVAVELHQSGPASTDVAFALTLLAQAPLAPIILNPNQPTNRVIFANRTTTLSVNAIGSPTPNFQWFHDGVAIDPSVNPTATSSNYVIANMSPGDAGNYFVYVSNVVGTATSRTALVEYLNDTNPPVLVEAVGSATFDRIVVAFDGLVEALSGTDNFNYSVDGGLIVNMVTLNPDGASVTILLDAATPMAENTLYTVTVNSVKDLADNVIAPDSTIQFRSWITAGPCGGVNFALYRQVGGGTDINLLVNHPTYPNSPDEVRQLTTFDTGVDITDNYGGRVRGLFIPPVSGAWHIFVTADDGSRLFFNANGPSAAGAVLISQETPGCCTAFAGRQTGPFNLQAGHGYYMEGIYKEAGGGDYIRVAARLASDTTTTLAPMPSAWVGYPAAPAGVGGPVNVTQQPAGQTVFENTMATFAIAANNPNALPICYQWYRDGAEIAGANLATYSVLASLADDGAVFTVRASVIGTTIDSAPAVLHVVTDTDGPVGLRASGTRSLTHILLTFSERLEASTAEDYFNYSVSGFTVESADLDATGTNVLLSLNAPLTPGANYQVCAQSINDLAGNPLNPNPTCLNFRAFVVSCGFAVQELYFNIGASGAIADLRNAPIYPNSPSLTRYKGLIEANTADEFDNYGSRFSGFLVAPVTGNYNFFMASDDNGELWLSTDSNPANLQILATEPVWNNRRDWTGTTRRNAAAPENRSSTLFPAGIPLVAGQMYYYEALMKEGAGGDNLAVAWQIPGDPVPLNGSTPISGAYLASLEDPTGVSMSITTQPADTTFVIIPPLGAGSPVLLDEQFNTTNGNFTVANVGAPFEGPWTYDPATGSWKSNGQGDELQRPSSTRLTSPTLTVTRSGLVRLTFSHRYSFEPDRYDGGQVRVSINGGPFTAVPASAFTQNGYNGSLRSDTVAELANQPGYIETSAGHNAGTKLTTIANLGGLSAGDTIAIQFVAANDTNTRASVPQWEIDSLRVEQGGQTQTTVTFTTGVAANVRGDTNPPVFCQWYRNGVAIGGGTGTTLTVAPTLADNGAMYRSQCYTPGATVTSRNALLTVAQANTPPSFVCGPNQSVSNSSPRTVNGWATGIQPHSITRASIVYGSDFSSLPAGASVAGNAAVSGGVLHLTDAVNSQSGQFFTPPAAGALIESFSLDFKLRIGGGTCCGAAIPEGTSRMADGLSVNLGTDLGAGFGEEGTGTGLVISFDLWDNGEAGSQDASFTAPNIDVRFGGPGAQTIGYQALDGEREAGRPPSGAFVTDPATGQPMKLITGDAFAPVHISMDSDGTIDVDYKNVRVINNVQTGYQPMLAPRIGIGARTGGANANQWIDDLTLQAFSPDLSGPELNQTVHFNVTVDNPGLFSVQPAVSPTGTLTYTPAAGACGSANVTVVAQDNGGTANGGRDTSLPCNFTITVVCLNACPIANAQSTSTPEDTAKAITLTGTDPDANPLTYAILAMPAHGALSGTPPAVTYTPAANYCGADTFTFTVTDGTCRSTGTVNIAVACLNDCPTANAQSVTTGEDTAKAVVLTGSDLDGGGLTYVVIANPAHGTLSGTAPNVTYTPAANYCGPDEFRFTVNDGECVSTAAVSVVVVCTNDCPTANAASVATSRNTALPITLTGSDPEGSALTFVLGAPPAHGTLSGIPPNLTYTPAANYCGADGFNFTVNDGSCIATGAVTISVVCSNRCPVANAQSVISSGGAAVNVVLTASDADGDPLTYSVVSGPSHGTLSGTPPNLTYTPTAGYTGPDSFTFRASDGSTACNSTAVISIDVRGTGNQCPVAHITLTHPCSVPGQGGGMVIVSANNENGCVTLDGSSSTDANGDSLTYAWYLDGAALPFATGAVVSECFDLGSHTITLVVTDGQCTGSANLPLEIGTACEAVEGLILDINNANLVRKNKRPLLASLKASCASFERGNHNSAINQLEAFQNKVRAQIARNNPVEAARFIATAEAIIEAIRCSEALNQALGNDGE